MKEKILLNISGMSCVNCANSIEKSINSKKGVDRVNISFASSDGNFYIDTSLYSKKELISDIEELGYKAQESMEELEKESLRSFEKLKKTLIFSFLATIPIFILTFFSIFPKENSLYIIFFLASFVQFFCGKRFYTASYSSLKHKNYDMNVLIVLGTSAAYFYSTFVLLFSEFLPKSMQFYYFDSATVIISFVLLGKYLEDRSKYKASDFLKKLMNLTPSKANIIKDGRVEEVLASTLKIGEIVLIKSGEKIPVDGLIVEGSAEIDTSTITGESLLVYKKEEDVVLAGTLNCNGVIKVEVQKELKDTTLSKIINLLKNAQSKKIPISRFADKVSNIFVPIVITISLFTFFIWGVLFGEFEQAIVSSIAVLIISCPCALGLATPIAIVSSVSKGAKEGILIKNPEVIEEIDKIRYAVFDKTGTLTKGELNVVETNINEEYLSMVYKIESFSEHPISKAIVKYLEGVENQSTVLVKDIEVVVGFGIKASIEGMKILIGNKKFLLNHNVSIEDKDEIFFQNSLDSARGVVLVSFGDKSIGGISFEDSLKDNAIEVINNLKDKNITPILLTGDNTKTAKFVAKRLSINKVYSEVIPTKKYEVIKELQKNGSVMFIGDGINDAPSLKQANIGVTLNSGADISKDAGDIVLVNNDLESILKSINLSRESIKIVKQNLFWAFFYNALGIPIAAGVLYTFFGIFLTPMYAGIAMSFSSVSVVLNSLRLKGKNL